MIKTSLITLIALTLSVIPVLAVKNNEIGQQNQQQNQQRNQVYSSPAGNMIQNQNQVQTQNQGEDSNLQVNTQEQENLSAGQGKGLQNRSQNAIENMSDTARQVQQLLQVGAVGGIGDQVREIAREQNQAQNQIQSELNKLQSKGKFARLLTGTDYKAVKNLKQQLVQNQLRITQLENLQNQLSNQGDITMVQETIQAIIQENTSLQERITEEEQAKSIFGWLFRLFIK